MNKSSGVLVMSLCCGILLWFGANDIAYHKNNINLNNN